MNRRLVNLFALVLVATMLVTLAAGCAQPTAPAATATKAPATQAAAQPAATTQAAKPAATAAATKPAPAATPAAAATQPAQASTAPKLLTVADLGTFAKPVDGPADANYPNKPINVMIGYAPGGGSDVLANATQPYLERILGQSFVNVYKPGASGAIAWTEMMTVKPDGYTISISTTPSLVGNIFMQAKETKYRLDNFIPLYNVVTDPGILVVNENSPYKTFEEFVAYAKEHPNLVTVGNSGVWGDDYVAVLRLEKELGIKVVKVPFAGDGPSWQAALGGHVNASSNNLGIVYPQVKAGKLRALAVYAKERSPYLPDVPTLEELGFKLYSGSSRGYIVPKGTPKPAFDKLVDAFKQATSSPEFLANAEKIALPLDLLGPDEYAQYLMDDSKVTLELYAAAAQ